MQTVERLLEQQREMMREQREYQDRKTAEMEARLDAKDAKLEAKDAAIAELMAPAPAVSEGELAALQARLEGLHAAKLLTDEVRSAQQLVSHKRTPPDAQCVRNATQELYALEDIVADYAELKASVGEAITEQMVCSPLGASLGAARKLRKLCGLSGTMVGDAAFARQARRRYLAR